VLARDEIAEVERRRALRSGLVLVAAVGLVGTVAVGVLGHLLVSVAFGPGYAGAEPLLVPYALATALFALANLLAAAEVARRRIAAAVALAAGALVQTGVLALWGSTPGELVWLQVGAMAATLVAVAVTRLVAMRRIDA
jgi:O-antigen/teichoic acid export membrane protein